MYPGLALAEVLRDRSHDVEFVGGDRLEARVVPEAGFPFHAIVVRRPPSVRVELLGPRGLAALVSIARAIPKARTLLRRLRADVVVGMGGFAALPVALAAPGPLVLHEQNARLSASQRVVAWRARALALGLPIAGRLPRVRTELVGQPVRRRIAALASLDDAALEEAKAAARSRLGLDPSAPTLLVLGGSLGSQPLNDLVPRVSMPPRAQILHLTGSGNEERVASAWGGARANVLGFMDDIEQAYLACDVAVSRSGASAVAELAIGALPSVLVPLPTLRRGDQEANARLLEAAGGAVVVLQSHERFVETVGAELSLLLSDASLRTRMSRAARSFARSDGAERLADVVESAASSP